MHWYGGTWPNVMVFMDHARQSSSCPVSKAIDVLMADFRGHGSRMSTGTSEVCGDYSVVLAKREQNSEFIVLYHFRTLVRW